MSFVRYLPVKNFERYYEVSNTGLVRGKQRFVNVKNINRNRAINSRVLKTYSNKDGYLIVKLSQGNKAKTYYVHRLVAEAFLPNPDNLPEVNHKSGIKTDNTSENLEWISHQANVIHAYKTGLSKNQGGNHKMAIGVIDNTIGQKFDTIKEWCDAIGIKYSTGRNILSGWNTSKIIDLSKIVLVKHSKDNSNGK